MLFVGPNYLLSPSWFSSRMALEFSVLTLVEKNLSQNTELVILIVSTVSGLKVWVLLRLILYQFTLNFLTEFLFGVQARTTWVKILLKSNSNSNKVIDACDSSGTFFFSLISLSKAFSIFWIYWLILRSTMTIPLCMLNHVKLSMQLHHEMLLNPLSAFSKFLLSLDFNIKDYTQL